MVSRAVLVAVNLVSKQRLLWSQAFSIVGRYRYEEEIKILKTEIQNLTQKNAALLERTAIVKLELLRDRILFDLKLGKQAPIYKAVQKALNHFIAKLTQSEKSIF